MKICYNQDGLSVGYMVFKYMKNPVLNPIPKGIF
jgi:hypothetical protein